MNIPRHFQGGLFGLLVFFGLVSAGCSALLDPSFEAPKYVSPWTYSDGALWRSAGIPFPNPRNGPKMLGLEVYNSAGPSFSFVRQTQPTTGNQLWTFGGYMLNYDFGAMQPDTYSVLQMVFKGSFGEQTFSSEHFTPPVTDSKTAWTFGSFSALAPAGSEEVTFYVKLVQQQGGGGGYSSIYWDDMSATVVPVPEPPLTGLLAVGVACIAVGGEKLVSWWRRLRRAT